MPAVNVLDSASTEIVPVDYNRTLVVITNTDGSAKCHVSFGEDATTSHAYIGPGGNMTIGDSRCKSAINGISSSGTLVAKYSKLSAGS
jgi:hypothetical protein